MNLQIKKEAVLVTPEIAKQWLERNSSCQRNLNRLRVEKLAEIMIAGRWNVNHPAVIMFDTDNKLRNGQHRLNAVIKSGACVWMSVWYNCPSDLCRDADAMVLPRTVADDFSVFQDRNLNAAAIRILSGFYAETEGGVRSKMMSVLDAEKLLPAYDKALAWIAPIAYRYNKVGLLRTPTSMSLVDFFNRHEAEARQFLNSYIQIDGPIQQARVLRDYNIRLHGMSGKSINAKLRGIAIHACLKFKHNMPVTTLRGDVNWDSEIK